jgi:hypothetical protein
MQVYAIGRSSIGFSTRRGRNAPSSDAGTSSMTIDEKMAIGGKGGPFKRIERGDQLTPIEHFSENGGFGYPDADGQEPDRIIPTGHFRT